MSQYIHIIHIAIPGVDKEIANSMAAEIDPDFGGDQTFGDPMYSADGQPPGTHIVVSTAATETMRQEMLTALSGWQATGMSAEPKFWQLDAHTETLVASNVTAASGQPWTIEQTMAAAGIQRVAEQGPPDEE